jgi:dTDP-4-amino-4,6-dideoxygalactose transaminase
MYNITKVASNNELFKRNLKAFPSARAAFKEYLKALKLSSNDLVLLPAYIGWNKHEGSGVFDPIKELNLKYEFYAIDKNLQIVMDDLQTKLDNMHENGVLLIIHYFGRPDPNLIKVVKSAQSKGIKIIEDAAHALYSSWVGGSCGSIGDATIYSLHKMLPTESGGILQLNSVDLVTSFENYEQLTSIGQVVNVDDDFLRVGSLYDMVGIARVRKENEDFLRNLIMPLQGNIDLLWPELMPSNVYLQTLPVIIKNQIREDFYFGLNEAGFGAVSLYHTMIKEINKNDYPDSYKLARTILNLPIHQECSKEGLKNMVRCMESLIK